MVDGLELLIGREVSSDQDRQLEPNRGYGRVLLKLI